jgi:translation initiation factor 1A
MEDSTPSEEASSSADEKKEDKKEDGKSSDGKGAEDSGEKTEGEGAKKEEEKKPKGAKARGEKGGGRRGKPSGRRSGGGGGGGGRRRPPPGTGPVRVRLPRHRNGEIFGIAETLLGGSRIMVICEDGKSRLARIPGKMKKREWIRAGDLVIIKPWQFQDEKADVVWRYTKNQASNLARRRLIPDSINVF